MLSNYSISNIELGVVLKTLIMKNCYFFYNHGKLINIDSNLLKSSRRSKNTVNKETDFSQIFRVIFLNIILYISLKAFTFI